jgi:hypothetical protein
MAANQNKLWLAAGSLLGLVVFTSILFRGMSGQVGAGPGASFQAGKTEMQSSMHAGSTSSSSDGATFSSRRVLLFLDGRNQPLLDRVSHLMSQQLRNHSLIESLETAPAGTLVAEGSEGPDLFIRLDLKNLENSGIVPRQTKAVVEATLGSTPWANSGYYSDETSPPLVQFSWRGTLQVESTFKGIRSDSLAELATGISAQFSQAISNELKAISAKFPPLPELPRSFYGPYSPVADLPFLKSENPMRECSYYDLLTHNQTFWRFSAGPDPVAQLQKIIKDGEAAGWKLNASELTNTVTEYAIFRQGDDELSIFRSPSDVWYGGRDGDNKHPPKFTVHYRKPFSRIEREAAIDVLFSDAANSEALVAFQHLFSSEQRQRFFGLIKKTPSTSPKLCVTLAENYLSERDTNSALRMLLRAKALAVVEEDATGLLTQIGSLSEKVSFPEKPKLELTPEVCREAGFIELTNGFKSLEMECRQGQPLLLFGAGKRGIETIAHMVRPSQKGVWDWRLSQVSENSRSSSVVSHKRLELFFLVFSHSGAGAAGLDPLQRLFAPTQFFNDRFYGCCPHEGSGVVVPGGKEFLNGCF